MRVITISILILFSALSANATDATPPKWKVGVIAAGHYGTGLWGFHPVFLPGVQVNRVVGKLELRAGAEHVKISGPSFIPMILGYGNGIDNRTTLRVGVQRNFSLSPRWTLYTSADAAYRRVYSVFEIGGCFGPLGFTKRKMNGGGLITSIGADFKLSDRISIFAEYRAEAFLYDVKEKFYYNGADVKPTPYNYTQIDFRFGNIGHAGISISI